MKATIISLLSITLLALGTLSGLASEKEGPNGPRLTATAASTSRAYLPYLHGSGPTATFTPTQTPTATNTATATATDVFENDVSIEVIEYDPPGLDSEGEYVDIRNNEFVSIDMTGWTLRDEVDTVFTFPSFSLAGQATVRVWIRSGINDASNLYWGRNSATWNNDGDTASLRDNNGVLIDSCTYPGGGEFAVCSGGIWP